MSAVFLQKPVVEQLCLFLKPNELKPLFALSRSLFAAFAVEKSLKTSLDAHAANWNDACASGRLDVVCFLHENNVPGCTRSAMDCAASAGHLEVLQWLHENRQEGCSDRAVCNAIYNGHLRIAKWLIIKFERYRANINWVMTVAACHGRFQLVRWLVANYKSISLQPAISHAELFGHHVIVEWLMKQQQTENRL